VVNNSQAQAYIAAVNGSAMCVCAASPGARISWPGRAPVLLGVTGAPICLCHHSSTRGAHDQPGQQQDLALCQGLAMY
jgi:hypothetical protein